MFYFKIMKKTKNIQVEQYGYINGEEVMINNGPHMPETNDEAKIPKKIMLDLASGKDSNSISLIVNPNEPIPFNEKEIVMSYAKEIADKIGDVIDDMMDHYNITYAAAMTILGLGAAIVKENLIHDMDGHFDNLEYCKFQGNKLYNICLNVAQRMLEESEDKLIDTGVIRE